jgi:hypothetical protein
MARHKSTKPCSVLGCSRHHEARGFCRMHYKRWLKRGDPGRVESERSCGNTHCSIPGCSKPHVARGFCGMHLQRWYTRGDPGGPEPSPIFNTTKCTVDGCNRLRYARGYCHTHYDRWRRHGDPGAAAIGLSPADRKQVNRKCSVGGCNRKHNRHGLCAMHYARKKNTGDLGPVHALINRGADSAITRDGYRILYHRDHPNATANGCILEHIFVMSKKLGRPITKGETIHHKNGNRADNRPENLELWASRHPRGQRVTDHIAFAAQTLLQYLPDKTVWPKSLSRFREAMLTLPPQVVPKHRQLNLF